MYPPACLWKQKGGSLCYLIMDDIYQIRTYRHWVEGQDLLNFTVKISESDLFIRADKQLYSQARECLQYQRQLIKDYIQNNPEFVSALEPYAIKGAAPDIVQEMVQAAFSAGVGPMAAVAGALAEYVGKELLKYAREVIVENGGDIFMSTRRVRKVGIFAGESCYNGKLALEITPGDKWGICTSSGRVGPSLSFGRADAAIVVCDSAILADAWATRLGNMVKLASDIEKTLDFVKKMSVIKGAVIIVGDKIGAWGDIKLIKQRRE